MEQGRDFQDLDFRAGISVEDAIDMRERLVARLKNRFAELDRAMEERRRIDGQIWSVLHRMQEDLNQSLKEKMNGGSE